MYELKEKAIKAAARFLIQRGDEVWMREIDDSFKPYPVVAFADDGTPLVGRYDRDGDWSWNPNNRVVSDTVRVASRG